ncbi:MAG TPA: hypothetical protein PKL82_06630 [Anaerolineaceae bacterium]|nr:hypothetical protein [Anaerolineaceae bacterium]NMD27591.1 hypothetical protein [Chloroflexota bacterium]HOA22150.1 hypothetical protein [Anaerolineaceae bacterium]
MTATRTELPNSTIIQNLCAFDLSLHPYHKWNGAHWRLVQLADIGYPYINPRLQEPRAQVYAWLFSERHLKSIRSIEGRTRRCASQEANAVFSSIKLNMVDEKTEELVNRLLRWQWPDGGWNCDKRPQASHSSFWETWTPLRALLVWEKFAGSNSALNTAIENAAELFLRKQLFLRETDGQAMQWEFTRLRHPSYWKYDILVGLELMKQAGKLGDQRCTAAIALLENKMGSNGAFFAEDKQFQAANSSAWHYSPVDWGSVSTIKMNPWLTVRALSVLKAAGKVVL